jgi:hypothetical protein
LKGELMPRARLIKSAALLILFALCSCASPQFTKIKVTIPNDFKMSATDIRDKIPLTAGLYLKPDLKNFIYRGDASSVPVMSRVSFFMGSPLCIGSERMLRNIFKGVVVIDPLDTNLSSQNIDVIVTPEVIGISRQQVPEQGNKLNIMLTMKWNVASLDGKNIYYNSITGEIFPKPIYAFMASTITEKEREIMIMLINEHFLKAQNDLYSNTWWKKQWWKESNR